MNRFLFLVFLFASVAHGYAQISPGELSKPHAELEGMDNCTSCHTLGGGVDANKCLDCHKEIARVVDDKHGYHFFVTKKQPKACMECHAEHHGKRYQLIYWPKGMDEFDHSKTGYNLTGKHAEKKCRECHKAANIQADLHALNAKMDLDKTFLGLDARCLGCHEEEHRGQLAKDCSKCHEFKGWKPATKFSHDKAKFRLKGKHQKVDCVKCHKPVLPVGKNKQQAKPFIKYTGLRFDNCSPCHEDVHRGKFGRDCQKCHTNQGWRQVAKSSFDHALTRYPLVGLHRRVDCAKCHKTANTKKRLPFANCTDCHRDEHFGQFADRKDGGRCDSCHDVFGFIPAKFDASEHSKTDYPLIGGHLAVPCVACHVETTFPATSRRGRKFDFKSTRCQDCHEDIHKKQFAEQIRAGGCETCHQTESWENTKFDHNKSRFPLIGKHQQVQCRKCHQTVDAGTATQRILFKPMDTACESCHKDIHMGQFKLLKPRKTCETCHNPLGWSKLIFDHNRDALFRIRGAHEKLPCNACHKPRKGKVEVFVLYRGIDRRCVGCHGGKQ